MNTRDSSMQRLRKAAVSGLLAALLLVGCGGENPDAMLASAKEYLAKNDPKAATIQLKNALQQKPDLAEARFLLGKALLEAGDATGAEVELRKAQGYKYSADQVTPLLARSMLALGQADKVTGEMASAQLSTPQAKADLQTSLAIAYLMQNKPTEADAAYAAAVAAQPGYPPALLGQAKLKASQGDMPGAMVLADSAIATSPELYDGWQLKGDLSLSQGDAAGAMLAYRKAIELRPTYLPAHMAIIRQLLADGKLDEAAQQLTVMKGIAPGQPQTFYLEALLAYQNKNFPAAREAILQMLKLTPNSPLGLQLAGLVEYELKAYPQAEIYLLKALPGTPELGVARRVLIATYLRGSQPGKALSVLTPVLEKIEKDSNMLALAGQVYVQNGEIEKAGEYFAKAAALDPQNAGKRTSLAMVSLAKGDSEVAIRDLEKVAAADPGNRADLTLIAAHLQRREFDAALTAIAGLEKKQPDDPLVYNLRGTALLGKRDLAGARASFEKALALNPTYYPAAANLANMDIVEKKTSRCHQAFRDAAGQGSQEHAGSPGARTAACQGRRQHRGGGGSDQSGGDRKPDRGLSAAGTDRSLSWHEGDQERAFRGPGGARRLAERGHDSRRCRACPAGSRRV